MVVAYFTTDTLDFLQDLEVHNDKAWFEANRHRYEDRVKTPMLRFIGDLQEPMRAVSKHVVVDPQVQGGSMFRIHRDLRFSHDRSPYKTNTGAQFRHERGRDVHAPGFYLHLEPGNCGMAAGMWRPPTAILTEVRRAIVDKPGAWTRARNAVLVGGWELSSEDALKRAPKGFDPGHPHIDDLRLRSYVVWHQLDESEVTSDDFLGRFVGRCGDTLPLMRYLCRVLGLPF